MKLQILLVLSLLSLTTATRRLRKGQVQLVSRRRRAQPEKKRETEFLSMKSKAEKSMSMDGGEARFFDPKAEKVHSMKLTGGSMRTVVKQAKTPKGENNGGSMRFIQDESMPTMDAKASKVNGGSMRLFEGPVPKAEKDNGGSMRLINGVAAEAEKGSSLSMTRSIDAKAQKFSTESCMSVRERGEPYHLLSKASL